jgi:hypothetical protein
VAALRGGLMGFGFEAVSTQAEREQVMGRALDHLLAP